MRRRRLLLGVMSMGYGKLVSAIVQLAMVPALAAGWGLQLYGQWLLLSAIPVFLGASDFGFGTAAGNRLIGEVANDDPDAARVTLQSALVVVLGGSLVVLALAMLIIFGIPGHVLEATGGMAASEARQVLAVLCLFGLIALQSSLFAAAVRAAGHFARSTTLDATIQLVEGMAVIAAVWLGYGPMVAACVYLAVRTCGVAGHVAQARHYAPWLQIGFRQASRARIRELLRPALAAMMLPLSQAGYVQGSALAVGAAAGAGAVPIFTSLRTLSRVGLQLLMALNLPILPEFTAEHAKRNTAWIARATGGIVTLNLFVGLIFAAGLWAFGLPLLALWTSAAIQPPQAMITLTAFALIASTLWNPLSNLLLAVNRHEGFTYIFIVSAAVATGLTYGLVGRIGITGAAVAGLALDLTMAITVLVVIRRVTGSIPIGLSGVAWALPLRWQRTTWPD